MAKFDKIFELMKERLFQNLSYLARRDFERHKRKLIELGVPVENIQSIPSLGALSESLNDVTIDTLFVDVDGVVVPHWTHPNGDGGSLFRNIRALHGVVERWRVKELVVWSSRVLVDEDSWYYRVFLRHYIKNKKTGLSRFPFMDDVSLRRLGSIFYKFGLESVDFRIGVTKFTGLDGVPNSIAERLLRGIKLGVIGSSYFDRRNVVTGISLVHKRGFLPVLLKNFYYFDTCHLFL